MIKILSQQSSSLPSHSTLVLFAFEKARKPLLPWATHAAATEAYSKAQEEGFEGKLGQVSLIHSDAPKVSRFLFCGLGSEQSASLQSLRKAAASVYKRANDLRLPEIIMRLPSLGGAVSVAQAATEGLLLGSYRYSYYWTSNVPKTYVEIVRFLAKDASELKHLRDGVQRGEVFAGVTNFARNLINQAPSDTTPEVLAKAAKAVAGKSVRLQIFNKARLEKMGMGAVLGVNRGSHRPPYFLHFTYKPSGHAKRRIGICGKGITFDSGGLSLKPAKSMETMKYDMAGAASVIAIFKALSVLKPPVEVQGFAPLTENMPGGNALKPGDVLKTYSGKTIEVLNTDAEGRLVLSDTLWYAGRQNLDEVIDLATLTGACIIALGSNIAAIMGTNPALTERIKTAAGVAGEKVWELPLEKEYEDLIKSNVADLKNIGPVGEAGTIIGGLFLKAFVKDKLPWAHIDIASTGWTNSATTLSDVGATGVMIRTLLHYIMSYA